ncbi:DNA polymerase III, clamp loader complex, gamma/delta/delta subunit [Sphaerosporella brunnea]|uniref:DNA polymerase III, clamp loader complex, gamma/delta/delta subunit n=1 Tax=Sphaerosporella brunnea TaxID=1250544 RepID=A0A5J5FAM5_9PEZI|nr:DNA polymerase III, clamp loader complex, gamma/delta/delta subunit [Sphaerosporella brunnea]
MFSGLNCEERGSIYHEGLSSRLKSLANSGDFPHLLIYGPSGAGKKDSHYSHRCARTNRKIEFNIVAPNYHLEIAPSDVGSYNRVVSQDLLKETAQTQQVDLAAKQCFKIVVINEAEYLTRKCSPNLRLILVANSTANTIPPIKSRTLLVRVAAPTKDEIVKILKYTAHLEKLEFKEKLAARIADESGRNLRRALLMFEAVYSQNEILKDDTPIPPPDFEALISQIADKILAEHTPSRIMQVRAKLHDLLTHCIPATTIFEGRLNLGYTQSNIRPHTDRIDDALKPDVIKWSAFYEHRIHIGSKHIFHLEAFVAKFMRILESCVMGIDD